jgi:hypothetical protein
MNEKSTPDRVNEYHLRLKQFWGMQNIVYKASYNATNEPKYWETHEFLSNWLRNEANELFKIGVNVYH